MKKIFALNLLLMSAVAHAQELPYFAINNPDNNGTGNSAGLFSLNSTSTAFLHGSREWPTLSAKTNNGIATYIPDNSYSGPAGSALTMTNARALNLGIDPISGEVTIVDGSTGATCTKYTRNTISGVLCDLLEYTFVGEDISGYNGGWRSPLPASTACCNRT